MISAVDLTREYRSGERMVHALAGVSLEIARHEFVAMTGPSGCGKSTLLHLLGGLDSPSSGTLRVDGLDLHEANDTALTKFRRNSVGIVFQFFNLLPTLTALENAALPLLLGGVGWAEARARAERLIAQVGLAARGQHLPHQLSGGEQQRVAIARALINDPALLLADEPTGNLDSHSATAVLQLLTEIAHERLATVIVVTHDPQVARAASRQVQMRDGKIVGNE